MHIDPENWMGHLGPEKLSAPLISIAIPGSHDSMTYSITPKSPVAPDSEPFIQHLVKYFGFIVRPIVYSWCVTQSCTVLEQLTLGIRYFDIRVATKAGTENYFFVHGLYGDKVNNTFLEIAKFLAEHSSEIAILDMQHFHQFTNDNHRKYINILINTFGNTLCPCPYDPALVTLDWMRKNGYQVIVIYRHAFAQGVEELWTSNKWPTPWPQTMSPIDLLKFLDSRLRNRPKHSGFVCQCVLTPTNLTVLKSPFAGVRSKCAIPACKVTVPWLQEQEHGCVNVAISDFVHINNAVFPKTVVSLNFT